MSNLRDLVLDFDISGPPIQRKAKKQEPVVTPAQALQQAEEVDLKKNTAKTPVEIPETAKTPETPEPVEPVFFRRVHSLRKKITLASTALLFILLFSFYSLFASLSYHERLLHASCANSKHAVTCHFSCGLRSDCGGNRVVRFHSRACADSVRVVHSHFYQHYERVPAYTLRIKNTTSFEVAGERVVFTPCEASCAVSVQRVSHKRKTTPEFQNKLVWVATDKEKAFELRTDKGVLAVVQAEAVLYASVHSKHRVFSFPLNCNTNVKVFDKNTGVEIESFDYCHERKGS